MTESKYQAYLIKKLERLFPDCIIIKNDPQYRQGMIDLTIFYGLRWAALEVKISKDASTQPNQDYYVERLGAMSFAAYIYPENEEEVLSALQQAFESPGRTRVSES